MHHRAINQGPIIKWKVIKHSHLGVSLVAVYYKQLSQTIVKQEFPFTSLEKKVKNKQTNKLKCANERKNMNQIKDLMCLVHTQPEKWRDGLKSKDDFEQDILSLN